MTRQWAWLMLVGQAHFSCFSLMTTLTLFPNIHSQKLFWLLVNFLSSKYFSINNYIVQPILRCHLQYIYVDSQTLATEGRHQFFPPSVVILDLNAYMMDLSLKVVNQKHHLKWITIDYQIITTEGGRSGKPPSVYFHWLSAHCYWRWQIWEKHSIQFCQPVATTQNN